MDSMVTTRLEIISRFTAAGDGRSVGLTETFAGITLASTAWRFLKIVSTERATDVLDISNSHGRYRLECRDAQGNA